MPIPLAALAIGVALCAQPGMPRGLSNTRQAAEAQPKTSSLPSGGRQEANPDLTRVQFTTETMADAAARSIRERKVLIAVISLVPAPFNRRNWWEQPTVAAWTLQHAIVVPWDDTLVPKPDCTYRNSFLDTKRQIAPECLLGFGVFIDGRQAHLRYPARDPLSMYIRDRGNQLASATMGHDLFVPGDVSKPVTATTVLVTIDFALEAAKARDPVWATLHDQLNPTPPRPDPIPPLHAEADGLAAPYDPPGAVGDAHADVLGVLLEARRLVDERSTYVAAGEFTWLWEQGAEADPAFDPYRTMVLPEELRVLAANDAGLQERIRRLRDRDADLLPWAHSWDRLRWLAIGHACSEESVAAWYLDEELLDGDMGALITRTEYYAYTQMITALDAPAWNDLPGSLKRAAALAARAVPRDVHRDDIAKVETFTKKLALYEACRAYALALRAHREAETAQARALALRLASTQPPGMVRRMLVAAAIAEGRADATHRSLLIEAAAEQGRPVESDPLLLHIGAP